MATHSSVLSWRIPGMEGPSGLPSMGSQSRTRLKRLSSSSSSSLATVALSLGAKSIVGSCLKEKSKTEQLNNWPVTWQDFQKAISMPLKGRMCFLKFLNGIQVFHWKWPSKYWQTFRKEKTSWDVLWCNFWAGGGDRAQVPTSQLPWDKDSVFSPPAIPAPRKRQPTPVLLAGESHGQRSLVGYSPWGRKELDTTEQLHFHFH